jgi:Anti-sigma-K factor rskA
MTDSPDFRELVGEDMDPREAARLERVHELLVAAGPPPELPPHLEHPEEPVERDNVVQFLPRRRTGLVLGIAAALTLIAFVGGFVAGRARQQTFPTAHTVAMHGTPAARDASATIDIADRDSNGNWPLKVVVHGLKPLPKGTFYEMYLTRHGKAVASCGAFRLESGDSIRLNAPYDLREYTGWIVTREGRGGTHPVVLRTSTT